MPIRPEMRPLYPPDWPQISHRIKADRAGWRCECDGRCGRPRRHLDTDGRCHNRHGQPAYGTGSLVVLTTAHLEHDPTRNADDDLLAMCAGCHLHYDLEHHAQTRAATWRALLEQAGQLPIGGLP